MSKQVQKMSFREYWESKDRLITASDEIPKVTVEYQLTKYCKIPVLEDIGSTDKQYISFKPNDVISILWEYHDMSQPTPIALSVLSETEDRYFPCWNNMKMSTWVNNNTVEK